ncbi:MAG: MGMT family protein [Chloroflexi bacterium]|nr:MGMT family protein [Chloroflexota bacterium]
MPAAHADEETAFHLFREQTFILIRQIPSGMVMAYGDVAREIPLPKGVDAFVYQRIRARWIGYALKKCPLDVPWWRVVNNKGRISHRVGHGPQVQRVLLEQEGVIFNRDGGISLEKYRWINKI